LGLSTLPTDVGPDEVKKISLGGNQSCVLFTNGKVKCWGYFGGINAIGDGLGEMGTNLPYLSLSNEKAIDISNGINHSCALFESRKVKCWGSGTYGQLGQGNTTSRIIFPPASGLNIPYINFGGELVDKLYASGNFNCVILKSGQVKCWGSNASGNLGLEDANNRGDSPNEMGAILPYLKLGEEKPVEMALGDAFSCALFMNGKVKCWGDGSSGQLGSGSKESIGLKKNQMGSNLPYVDLGAFKAVHLFAGKSSMCAVDEGNRVKCWGDNADGYLGLGDSQSRGSAPDQMGENLPLLDFGSNRPSKWFNGGKYHNCFLSERSEIKCWGFGFRGVLGTESNDNIGDQGGELAKILTSVNLGVSEAFIEN
jgi:alpha-tubulin suppressor-like RCC1 family protein